MRLPVVVPVFLLLGAPAAAQNWTPVNLGTGSAVRAIQAGASRPYAVGDGGLVVRADDGTLTTWSPVDVGTLQDLLAVHEPSAGQAWISGDAGTCRRLVTGVWEGRNLPTAAEDFVVFSRSSGWSYAAGSGGSVYRTTDGGDSWVFQTTAPAGIRDGNGFVSSTAVCVGDAGTILKTTNGGVLWTQKTSGTSEDLLAYKDVSGGIVCAGTGGVMLRSSDAGETWSPVASGTTETIYDLDTSGQNTDWVLAVGAAGTCLQSTDAGVTWCPIDSGTTADLFACDMTLNSTWVVAGAGGLMLRTTNAGGGCVVSPVEDVSWGRVKSGYREPQRSGS